eukprot:4933411-Heterocapsa_arctica.AAC.1
MRVGPLRYGRLGERVLHDARAGMVGGFALTVADATTKGDARRCRKGVDQKAGRVRGSVRDPWCCGKHSAARGGSAVGVACFGL